MTQTLHPIPGLNEATSTAALIDALRAPAQRPLEFWLGGERLIGPGYHVTEVKAVSRAGPHGGSTRSQGFPVWHERSPHGARRAARHRRVAVVPAPRTARARGARPGSPVVPSLRRSRPAILGAAPGVIERAASRGSTLCWHGRGAHAPGESSASGVRLGAGRYPRVDVHTRDDRYPSTHPALHGPG